MKAHYNEKDCEHLLTYQAYYPVAEAALLWCRVPPDEVQEELIRIDPHPHERGVFTHPYIPCFEVRCRIIQDAIDKGALPASRENGKVVDEHIKPERRHVSREHLKAWIAKEHPADKPSFLFDEIERKTHAAINADAFHALQADRDALKARIKKAEEWAKGAIADKNRLTSQIAEMTAAAEKANAPSPRSETAYLNIIGALLEVITGDVPGFKKHPDFVGDTKLIEAIEQHFQGFNGLSKSNLSRKFPEAKRGLTAS